MPRSSPAPQHAPRRLTRPTPVTTPPQPIASVLDGVIDNLGVRARMDQARIVEAWAQVAGLRINRVTASAWVVRGTLHVRITSAAWRNELHLQRHAWRDRLNQHLGRDLVSEVTFR